MFPTCTTYSVSLQHFKYRKYQHYIRDALISYMKHVCGIVGLVWLRYDMMQYEFDGCLLRQQCRLINVLTLEEGDCCFIAVS